MMDKLLKEPYELGEAPKINIQLLENVNEDHEYNAERNGYLHLNF